MKIVVLYAEPIAYQSSANAQDYLSDANKLVVFDSKMTKIWTIYFILYTLERNKHSVTMYNKKHYA
jgi:hypothetical protein